MLFAMASAIIYIIGGIHMTFAEIIKNIRVQKNFTQEQFARELNVSFSTISRWENNHAVPSELAKMRLLEYCKKNSINCDDLQEMTRF